MHQDILQPISTFLAWRVVVYRQIGGTRRLREDTWHGLERVLIAADMEAWIGASKFNPMSIRHAAKFGDLCLTFGRNTSIFNLLQRLKGIPDVIDMEDVEGPQSRRGIFRQAIRYTQTRVSRGPAARGSSATI